MGRGQGGHLYGAAPGTRTAQRRAASERVPQALFDDASRASSPSGPEARLIIESRSSWGARDPWEQGQTVPDRYGRRHHYMWTGPTNPILINGDLSATPDKEIVTSTYAALVAAGRYTPEQAREHLANHVLIHGANTARREAIFSPARSA
jgi:hypothetical protein